MSEVSVEVPSTEVETVVKEMVNVTVEPVLEPVNDPDMIKNLNALATLVKRNSNTEPLVTVEDGVVYSANVSSDSIFNKLRTPPKFFQMNSSKKNEQ